MYFIGLRNIYLPKQEEKNYLIFRLKFLQYNKMFKPTKRARDQKISVTMFALVSV